MTNFLAFAHRLADLSSDAILPHFRSLATVENKRGEGDFDPVTAADRAGEKAIRDEIARVFPHHGVIGEEFDDTPGTAPERWIIDPIDGTRAFVIGMASWGTLIGLQREGEMELGLMNQPFTGERFWASRGGGAFFSRNGGAARPMNVRKGVAMEEAVLASTDPHLFSAGGEQAAFARVRSRVRLVRYGGDCYFYCLLAAGFIDLVVEAGLALYDIAALIPIVEEAGGIVTDWQGNPAPKGGRIVAAGDERLHASALELLNAVE